MKKITILLSIGIVSIGTILAIWFFPTMISNLSVNSDNIITVYKSPSCGCCKKWVDYLKDHGFKTKIKNVQDVRPIKTKHGINSKLASCHTAIVGNYVIEGHVPAEAIKKLLKESPNIKGLAVPGMPIGSPGMEGPNPQSYVVYGINHDGQINVFQKIYNSL